MIKERLSFELLGQTDLTSAGPRLGLLSCHGRQAVATPNHFSVTSRGVIPHITPDVMFSKTRVTGVYMAFEDFIGKACSLPMISCPDISLHNFSAIPKGLFTLLAPRRTPAVSVPYGNSNSAISVFSSYGFQKVSNRDYINYTRSLRPDLVVAMADISYGLKPGTKRLAKMVARTQEWLSEMLLEKTDDQAIFAPVLPINASDQTDYLNYISDDVADKISGLALYDTNLLPEIPATTNIFRIPRLSLDEPLSPLHILEQISLGIDIFTLPFVGVASDSGIALSFRFPRPLFQDRNPLINLQSPLGIDMWQSMHSTSREPLTTECCCYSCKFHHRAYVHHLLSAKEMLGWVLLQIHNQHILAEFFTSIRDSISKGRFAIDYQEFAKTYVSELPRNTRQGPRVRGHQSRCEGPGEQKKNPAAWVNWDHNLTEKKETRGV